MKHVDSPLRVPWGTGLARRAAHGVLVIRKLVFWLIGLLMWWIGYGLVHNAKFDAATSITVCFVMACTLCEWWLALTRRIGRWQLRQWRGHIAADNAREYFFGTPLLVWVAYICSFPGVFLVWMYGFFWLRMDTGELDREVQPTIDWWVRLFDIDDHN